MLQAAKYPENYGTSLHDREDKIIVKMCGLKIILVHNSILASLVFYEIKADKENTNILNLSTNACMDSMTPERISSKEEMASTIKLEDCDFTTLYEMEQYRQDHKMADIQQVLESKGWKT